ncbi:MAG: ribonuclease HI family protein [Candidatus Gracilibacteria bacterium]|nr:ribonuclease HI family protein [Candidatus Gracilibacteria bacterium]
MSRKYERLVYNKLKMILNVYTDGGSRGNPGNSGIGVYITDENNLEIEKRYKNIGIKTNNEAEYTGAYFGIKRAIELGAKNINLFMDSDLVIKQLSGVWKIKKDELKVINQEILEMIKQNNVSVKFNWIPREKNKNADRLSNIAMDQI